MLLFTNWFGTFLWHDGEVVAKALFPADAREIAKRMAAVQDFLVLREEQAVRDAHASKPDAEPVEVPEKRLARLGNHVKQTVPFLKPEDYGFEPNLLHEAMLIVAKERARAAVGPDVFVTHAVDALDELNKQYNFLMERLREWHGAHFPEFSGLVGDEKYLQMLCDGPERERLSKELGLEGESLGAEATEEDLAAMTYLAMQARNTLEAKQATEEYLRARVKQLAPNTSEIVGELLAARLIALAGGLERLARLPSSTVQMLGAEKAFFKHIKDGARPPKHGAIFQHPLVHKAPYWQRGKVARALAGKISIAAKVDFYKGGSIGKELATKVEVRAKDVAKQFPTAPKKMRIIRRDDGGRRDRWRGRGSGERGRSDGGRGRDSGRHHGREGPRRHEGSHGERRDWKSGGHHKEQPREGQPGEKRRDWHKGRDRRR